MFSILRPHRRTASSPPTSPTTGTGANGQLQGLQYADTLPGGRPYTQSRPSSSSTSGRGRPGGPGGADGDGRTVPTPASTGAHHGVHLPLSHLRHEDLALRAHPAFRTSNMPLGAHDMLGTSHGGGGRDLGRGSGSLPGDFRDPRLGQSPPSDDRAPMLPPINRFSSLGLPVTGSDAPVGSSLGLDFMTPIAEVLEKTAEASESPTMARPTQTPPTSQQASLAQLEPMMPLTSHPAHAESNSYDANVPPRLSSRKTSLPLILSTEPAAAPAPAPAPAPQARPRDKARLLLRPDRTTSLAGEANFPDLTRLIPPPLPTHSFAGPVTSFKGRSSSLETNAGKFPDLTKPAHGHVASQASSTYSRTSAESGFSGGIKYAQEREQQARSLLATGASTPSMTSLDRPHRPPDAQHPSLRTSPSSSRPSSRDRNSRHQSADSTRLAGPSGKIAPTGKRPVDARLPDQAPLDITPTTSLEPASSKPTKHRLNLLNPMTLLARRRNSHNFGLPQSPTSPKQLLDDNTPFVDPRIKGTRVHDFSTPRPRQKTASMDSTNTRTQSFIEAAQNARLFIEESPSPDRPQLTRARNTEPITTHAFVDRIHSPTESLTLPSAQQSSIQMSPLRSSVATASSDVFASSPQRPASRSSPSSKTASSRTSKASSKQKRSPSGASQRSGSALGIPQHMKSTSSRFSFDMMGAADQEKLLEDRHRQRQAERALNGEDGDGMGDEDDFDYDAMMDDDGLEERIPGVNADLDDVPEDDIWVDDVPVDDSIVEVVAKEPATHELPDVLQGPSNDLQQFAGFTFQQTSTTPQQSVFVEPETPRDEGGNVIGFATTFDDFAGVQPPHELAGEESHAQGPRNEVLGLGPSPETLRYSPIVAATGPVEQVEDDLYFDDGMIDPVETLDSHDFDESVFDNIDTDQYGRPINSYSSIPTAYTPPNLTTESSPQFNKTAETDFPESSPVVAPLLTQPAALNPLITDHGSYDLTQQSLAAYQSALAAAAQDAELSGKFRRSSGISSVPVSPIRASQTYIMHSHQTSVSPMSERETFFSKEVPTDAPVSARSSTSDLSDDAIAAANASVLASDDEGWYGQEFGFYSQPATSKSDVESVHGGYFDPDRSDSSSNGAMGLGRSASGRMNLAGREPNLTPITERSEYSARNSVMSGAPASHNGGGSFLGSLAGGHTGVNSPGLAQLIFEESGGWWGEGIATDVGLLNSGEGGKNNSISLAGMDLLNLGPAQGSAATAGGSGGALHAPCPVPTTAAQNVMTFESLLKLRRGAWGGGGGGAGGGGGGGSGAGSSRGSSRAQSRDKN